MLFFPCLFPHVTALPRSQSSHGALQTFIHEPSTSRSPHDLLEPLQRQHQPSNRSSSAQIRQQTHPHPKTLYSVDSSSRRPQLVVQPLSSLQHVLSRIPDVFYRPTPRQLPCCCTIVDELLLLHLNASYRATRQPTHLIAIISTL